MTVSDDTPRREPSKPERPKPPAEAPPGTLGTPPPGADAKPNTAADESREPANRADRPRLRAVKRDGRRWRTNVKSSAKVIRLDREFRRRAG